MVIEKTGFLWNSGLALLLAELLVLYSSCSIFADTVAISITMK
jgi:hypothetical protein